MLIVGKLSKIEVGKKEIKQQENSSGERRGKEGDRMKN